MEGGRQDYRLWPANMALESVLLEFAKSVIGVLLVNVGTPENYSFWTVRRYLSEFLSDRRVIEFPKILWTVILHLFILNSRPQKIGQKFRLVWNYETNESLLRMTSRLQATKTAERFRNEPVEIAWAFRYGNPTIDSTIQALKEKGCDRLILLPLFPQYSAATTASTTDEAFKSLMKQRFQMALRVIPAFYDNYLYIGAIKDSIKDKLDKINTNPEVTVIISYHSIPLQFHLKGDPYGRHCLQTTELIKKRLAVDYKVNVLTSFHSRFGPFEWLKPYTDDLIVNLARSGKKRILMVAPGFISDCFETIEELEISGAKLFKDNGGEEFVYVRCLNDSKACIDIIENVIRLHMQGFGTIAVNTAN
ncbi:unnamed protein product [Dracunculus medinensis]|uniref:Ferrochelatase n=1 Tax=Dracunculus medinensis TaxID=318479 RepID=A0A0N4UHV3_DRAME|nr:unnamed protein product [Dracunculus medinensis]